MNEASPMLLTDPLAAFGPPPAAKPPAPPKSAAAMPELKAEVIQQPAPPRPKRGLFRPTFRKGVVGLAVTGAAAGGWWKFGPLPAAKPTAAANTPVEEKPKAKPNVPSSDDRGDDPTPATPNTVTAVAIPPSPIDPPKPSTSPLAVTIPGMPTAADMSPFTQPVLPVPAVELAVTAPPTPIPVKPAAKSEPPAAVKIPAPVPPPAVPAPNVEILQAQATSPVAPTLPPVNPLLPSPPTEPGKLSPPAIDVNLSVSSPAAPAGADIKLPPAPTGLGSGSQPTNSGLPSPPTPVPPQASTRLEITPPAPPATTNPSSGHGGTPTGVLTVRQPEPPVVSPPAPQTDSVPRQQTTPTIDFAPQPPVAPSPVIAPQPAGLPSGRPAAAPRSAEARTDFDVDIHEPKAGDSYEVISRQHYGDPKYADALRAFNRGREVGTGGPVMVPPMYVLRQKFRDRIAAPRASDVAPAGGPARDRSDADGLEWSPANKTPTADGRATGTYTVRRGGMTLWDVAEEVYNDRRQYKRVWEANPNLDPNAVQPEGTRLRLPTDS
jgi:nucleoid-associated protein YgaU